MRFIVGTNISDSMLKKVFDKMDRGSDHLGVLRFSDATLAYQELYERVTALTLDPGPLST